MANREQLDSLCEIPTESFEAEQMLEIIEWLMREKLAQQSDEPVRWESVDYYRFPSNTNSEETFTGLTKCDIRVVSACISSRQPSGELAIFRYLAPDEVKFSLSENGIHTIDKDVLYRLEVILKYTFQAGDENLHLIFKTEDGQKIASTINMREPIGGSGKLVANPDFEKTRLVPERAFLTHRINSMLEILNDWWGRQENKVSPDENEILELKTNNDRTFIKKASGWIELLRIEYERLMEINKQFLNRHEIQEIETEAVYSASEFLSKLNVATRTAQ